MHRRKIISISILLLLLSLNASLVGCERPSDGEGEGTALAAVETPAGSLPATATPPPTAEASPPTMTPSPSPTPPPPATTIPAPTATAVSPEQTCGQLLPLLTTAEYDVVSSLSPDPAAAAAVRAMVPESALPALEQLLDAPGSVGLAAYRVGQEAEGVYLNADVPMPLASVVKVIHLVAYAEAVAAGELEPLSTVPLTDLESYYQPGLDLNANENAIAGLEESGGVFGTPPAVLMDKLPRMMIEFSSNAATDYLHFLLGQRTIEQTAIDLGLESQTAPCPFLGQFLAMGNHTREATDDVVAITAYLENPQQYGAEVMALATAYSTDPAFRDTANAWRFETRRPVGRTQRFFSDNLNARGSAADYARLMAIIGINGLSNDESSFIARRYLEWPMRFEANQELFSNVGYKGGTLPGILTTVYYAYPLGESSPVVVALFYRDLPGFTYRAWRNNLAHDELARWLLYDPEAIPVMAAMLNSAE